MHVMDKNDKIAGACQLSQCDPETERPQWTFPNQAYHNR